MIPPELCYRFGLDNNLRDNYSFLKAFAKHIKDEPMQREQALQMFVDSIKSNILNENFKRTKLDKTLKFLFNRLWLF